MHRHTHKPEALDALLLYYITWTSTSLCNTVPSVLVLTLHFVTRTTWFAYAPHLIDATFSCWCRVHMYWNNFRRTRKNQWWVHTLSILSTIQSDRCHCRLICELPRWLNTVTRYEPYSGVKKPFTIVSYCICTVYVRFFCRKPGRWFTSVLLRWFARMHAVNV